MYVYYPHGGEHYILTHWTHNRQTHLVLGRSPEACMRVVDSPKFTKDDWPEIRSFEKITIVQPSPDFQYEAKVLSDRREWEGFREYAMALAREFRDLTGAFPAGFMACPKYINRYSDPGYNAETDTDHFGCAVCAGGGGVVANRKVLLTLYHAAQKSSFGVESWRCGLPRKGQTRSRAPYADPNRTLYEMIFNPGHHQSGMDAAPADPAWNMSEALFFYHFEGALPEWLERAKKSVGDRKLAALRVRENGQSVWARRAEERNERRKAELTTFFNLPDTMGQLRR